MTISIPGIAGLGSLPLVSAYKNYSKLSQSKLDSATAKNAEVSQVTDYFKQNIGKVKSVDDLMKDRKLLSYVLSSYGLSEQINSPGLIKRVLTENPNNSKSAAKQLGDNRYVQLSSDLQLYKGNANALNSTTKTESIKIAGSGAQYFAVNKYASDATTVVGEYYTNSLDTTVDLSGNLTTTDGYSVMGLRLDNQGNILPSLDANGNPIKDTSLGYKNSDLTKINVGQITYKKTPTNEINLDALINRDASVYQSGNYNLTDTVKDESGNSHSVKFVITTSDNTNYQIKAYDIKDIDNPTSGPVLYDQSISVSRDANGRITKVGTDSGTTAKISLDWGDTTKTDYSFNLASNTRDYQLTQTSGVYDTAGSVHNLNFDYSLIDNSSTPDQQTWAVKIWDNDTNQYVKSINLQLDKNTNKVVAVNGQANAGYVSSDITWSNGDRSSLSLNFTNVKLGSSFYNAGTSTDSVELGKLQTTHISNDGYVTAVYDKKSGGTFSARLYKLAAANFGSTELQEQSLAGKGLSVTKNPAQVTTFLPFGSGENQRGDLKQVTESTTTNNLISNIQTKYVKSQQNLALGTENISLLYASAFKQQAGKISSYYQILGNSAMREVVTTVLDIPKSIANQPVETQAAAIQRRLPLSKFSDPKYVDQFAQRYLSKVQMQQSGSGSSDSYLTSLFA